MPSATTENAAETTESAAATTMSLEIKPGTTWAERLTRAGLPTAFEAGTGPEDPGWEVAFRSEEPDVVGDQARLWNRLEYRLWNGLLSTQNATGRFESVLLSTILTTSVQSTPDGFVIHLPLPSQLRLPSGESWQVETGYPRRGQVGLTYTGSTNSTRTVRLRVPVPEESVQLVRNGIFCPLEWEAEYLLLRGPWKAADHVEVRFGIPFNVRSRGGKSVRRAYPGAASIPGSVLHHGLRALVPMDSGDESWKLVIPVGVRKDGVLMLTPVDREPESPYEEYGDRFLTPGDPGIELVVQELWASLVGSPPTTAWYEVRFEPFLTAFDRGA